MLFRKFAQFDRMAVGVFVLLALLAGYAQAAEVAGEAVGVRPNATLRNGEGTVSLRVGADVHMGDLVRTSGRGEAQLVFTDDTRLVVGPNSSLVIEAYLLRSRNSANNFTVRALGGSFRMISGKSQKSAYRIKTPTATIGIRGTTFDLAVRRSDTDLFMYNGSARICTHAGCSDVQPSCTVYRASRNRNVRDLSNQNELLDSVARGFPFLGNEGRFSGGFRARSTGCNDATISRVARQARARAQNRNSIHNRGTHTNDAAPEPSRPDPPSDPPSGRGGVETDF